MSILFGVTVVIRDVLDRILLILREDNWLWALPGGLPELGEGLAQAAIRETEEETGLKIELVGFGGAYSRPGGGFDMHDFAIVARVVGGELRCSSPEVLDARFFHRHELPANIWGHHRQEIEDAFNNVGPVVHTFRVHPRIEVATRDELYHARDVSVLPRDVFYREFIEQGIESHRDLEPKFDYGHLLKNLFREQCSAGWILADPTQPGLREEKVLYDDETGNSYIFVWAPDRELRGNRQLLIDRGIIVPVAPSILINPDHNGDPCSTCTHNIHRQSPKEILLGFSLAGRTYHAGANLAPIVNNHFTIISNEHRPQYLWAHLIPAMVALVDLTGGMFRALYSPRKAGASIVWHEHSQAIAQMLPIERAKTASVWEARQDGSKISIVQWPVPTLVVEGTSKTAVCAASNKIIKGWRKLASHNTANVIVTKRGNLYRIYLVLRDQRKERSPGKRGAMASFEVGGLLVLSHETERDTYLHASADMVVQMFQHIAPTRQLTSQDIVNILSN